MTSYYKTISMALEESAYIDGATFLQTFWHIILPLAKPGFGDNCFAAVYQYVE